jgi:hypothetical protein
MQIDDGTADTPGSELRHAVVVLTANEARELLEALRDWNEHPPDDPVNAGWHAHITASDGVELTVAIRP